MAPWLYSYYGCGPPLNYLSRGGWLSNPGLGKLRQNVWSGLLWPTWVRLQIWWTLHRQALALALAMEFVQIPCTYGIYFCPSWVTSNISFLGGYYNFVILVVLLIGKNHIYPLLTYNNKTAKWRLTACVHQRLHTTHGTARPKPPTSSSCSQNRQPTIPLVNHILPTMLSNVVHNLNR